MEYNESFYIKIFKNHILPKIGFSSVDGKKAVFFTSAGRVPNDDRLYFFDIDKVQEIKTISVDGFSNFYLFSEDPIYRSDNGSNTRIVTLTPFEDVKSIADSSNASTGYYTINIYPVDKHTKLNYLEGFNYDEDLHKRCIKECGKSPTEFGHIVHIYFDTIVGEYFPSFIVAFDSYI